MKTHNVYTINEGSSKNYWLQIGSGFENKDGSINIIFNALPLNGKIQVRLKPNEKKNKSEGEA